MNQPWRHFRGQFAASLFGLTLVALTLGWSIDHPPLPFLVVEGRTFGLGTVRAGGSSRHSWVVENGGSTPLTLRTRFTSGRCGFSLWLGEERAIPPGGQLTLFLTCPSPARASARFSAYAEVTTNDPGTPKLHLRVLGITGP